MPPRLCRRCLPTPAMRIAPCVTICKPARARSSSRWISGAVARSIRLHHQAVDLESLELAASLGRSRRVEAGIARAKERFLPLLDCLGNGAAASQETARTLAYLSQLAVGLGRALKGPNLDLEATRFRW